MHVIISLFELHETTSLSMVEYLCNLHKNYNLMDHLIIFLKDEGWNMTLIVIRLRSMIASKTFNIMKFQ
jgi:hypothetical protein